MLPDQEMFMLTNQKMFMLTKYKIQRLNEMRQTTEGMNPNIVRTVQTTNAAKKVAKELTFILD